MKQEAHATKVFGYIFTTMVSIIASAMICAGIYYIYQSKKQLTILTNKHSTTGLITKIDTVYDHESTDPLHLRIHYKYSVASKIYSGNYYFQPRDKDIIHVIPKLNIQSQIKLFYDSKDPNKVVPEFLYTFIDQGIYETTIFCVLVFTFSIPIILLGRFLIKNH